MTSAPPRNAHRAAPRPRGRGATIALTALGVVLVAALGAGLLVGAGSVFLSEPDEVGLTSEDGGPSGAGPGSTATAPPTTVAPTTTPTTARPTTTAPPTTRPPPTTAPPTTAPPAPPEPAAADGTLEGGEEGPEVAALQARLVELGYWLGEPDGNYGSVTAQAVLAFQKAEGLSRDSVAGPATQAALAAASRPGPRIGGAGLSVEIDLERQIMLLVADGQTRWVLNTSTGTNSTPTPPGTFTISREIDGLREAPLGNLWRPKYFNGGIALHGSNSIPGGPASHGCTRLSNAAMDMIWESGAAPIGTTVVVY